MLNAEQVKLIRQLRHDLHAHPELSHCEVQTQQRLCAFLSSHTSLEIVRKAGWFYAVRPGSDPDAGGIAFRADMDALPIDEDTQALPYASQNTGISHKCGHDGHCAALCALALLLDEAHSRQTVYLIFQPAEETGAGGALCAELIKEKGITEIYAFHNLSGYPQGVLIYREGLTQPASEGLEIRFCGRQSHASAPEEGRNPAAAIAATALRAGELARDQSRGMRLCTVTGMKAGTGDFGIAAGEGSLRLTLRAEREEEMDRLEEEILSFAGERAKEEGLGVSYEISDRFPETRNSEKGISRVLDATSRLGVPVIRMQQMWRASEDFGWYLKECDGAIFYIGNGENWPALHTSGYDFNDRILERAAEIFWEIILTAG